MGVWGGWREWVEGEALAWLCLGRRRETGETSAGPPRGHLTPKLLHLHEAIRTEVAASTWTSPAYAASSIARPRVARTVSWALTIPGRNWRLGEETTTRSVP